MRQRKTPYDIEDPLNDGGGIGDDLQKLNMNELLIKYNYLQQYNKELENKLLYYEQRQQSSSTLPSSTSTSFLPTSSISSSSSTSSSSSSYDQMNDDEIRDKYEKKYASYSFYLQIVYDRGSWLVGLLLLQSFSSIILSKYELLLQNHPIIIYFLTMLIGAGGNAGSQATVRVIRELALGNITSKNKLKYIYRELIISVMLSIIMGGIGFFRVILSSHTTMKEAIAITVTLIILIIISVLIGTILPLFYHDILKIDPAHSSTSIQVLMDILGVLLVCSVASLLL